MLRSVASVTTLLLACGCAIAVASSFACGDLVIPNNTGDDGGSSNSSDDGGGGDDASVDARPPPNCDAGVEPVALACTGLYTNWTQLTLAPDVQAYKPGSTMWNDGADSSRWIWLPPGAKIDTTDPNNWVFPVGTKIWQELRLLGKRIETRFEWKEAAGLWFRTTFAWTEDQSAAPALTLGQPNARGLPYDIPPVSQCGQCHDGANDFVLGFDDVSLSMAQSAGLTLPALVQQQRLTKPPAMTAVVPGSDPTTIQALSYLHGNCGTSCHNHNAGAAGGATGLFLKLMVDPTGALPSSAQQTDTWTTAVNVPSTFTPYGIEAGGFWRVHPGDAPHSSVSWMTSRRDGMTQMPPIGSHLVDQNGVLLLGLWIDGLPH